MAPAGRRRSSISTWSRDVDHHAETWDSEYPGWYPGDAGARHDDNTWTPDRSGADRSAHDAPYHPGAIAALVLGIASFLPFVGVITGVFGVGLGWASLKHCEPRGPCHGRGFALAGIALSAMAIALWSFTLYQLATWDFDPWRDINDGL